MAAPAFITWPAASNWYIHGKFCITPRNSIKVITAARCPSLSDDGALVMRKSQQISKSAGKQVLQYCTSRLVVGKCSTVNVKVVQGERYRWISMHSEVLWHMNCRAQWMISLLSTACMQAHNHTYDPHHWLLWQQEFSGVHELWLMLVVMMQNIWASLAKEGPPTVRLFSWETGLQGYTTADGTGPSPNMRQFLQI
jgi:hypothetical protein